MRKYKILALVSCCLPVIGLLTWSAISPSDMISDIPANYQDNEYERALARFGTAERMKYYGVPGISLAVIKDGKLAWAKGYGFLQAGKPEKIDTMTVFSVGSVSKVGAAVIGLKLHESGRLNIDHNVNQYLRSWKIPENQYTRKQAVTLRHIMSHTAGLTVHGFADFNPDEELPNTVQILKGAGPAKNNPVYVNLAVGTQFRYSGGGTTVAQLVFEDLMGGTLNEVAKNVLFEPLNMQRSSYENPLPQAFGNIAKAHNRNGTPVALPRGYQSMPEAAASGLWTTPSDIAKLMIMLMKAHAAKHSYLSQQTVRDMMTPVFPSNYGLGPRISSVGEDIKFSHGGVNESYRAQFAGLLGRQNGIVIMTNGSGGSDLIEELMPVFESLLF